MGQEGLQIMSKKLFVLLLVLSLGLAVTGLQAQITTATLVGTVTDSTGAVVPGAEVSATNIDTNAHKSVATNDQGAYRIEFLPVGNYKLQVSSRGFKTYNRTGIVLEVAQLAQLDVQLEIGKTGETVEVNDALPLINVTNPEIGRTVQPQEIAALPLVNRDVYKLLDLTPGVQRNDDANILLGYPEQHTLINGGVDGGTGSVNYYLDGGSNMTGLRNTGNILPSPDAIQEFRVQTNSYSAEYGRFANGVVNVLTKSGTNRWHGSLFEYVRNTMFNANPWGFVPPAPGAPPQPKSSPLHRNQFGGTVGGPIIHDKTFFFLSYEALRQITNPFLTGAVVPTLAERSGDFSADPGIVDPTTKKLFVGNKIPAGRQDPTALAILNGFLPMPNATNPVTGVFDAWQGFVSNFDHRDQGLIKIDHALTHNQQLAASFFETYGKSDRVAGTGTNLPWTLQQFHWRQYNANVSHTWTLNDHMINQIWANYTRNFGGRLNTPQLSLGNLGSLFTVQGTPSLPQITISGGPDTMTLGSQIAGPIAGTNFYSLRDVFSFNHGRHAIKFGAEVSLDKDIQQTLLNNYGVFGFNGSATAGTVTGVKFAGNGFADFLLGVPNSITQDAPVTGYTNSWYTGLFVQDDIRVNNRLTVNLGLRYDIQTPPVDTGRLNRESTFVPGPEVGLPGAIVQSTVNPSAPPGLLFAGDAGIPRGVAQTRKDHFSPRIGFAFDPLGDGKTSIRGGAGIFYGSLSGNQWNTTTNFEPFAIRLTLPNASNALTGATLTNPYRGLAGGDPFPYNGTFISGGSIFGADRNFEWPYTYQLNFSVQHQFTKDLSIMAAYVGSLSHNLPYAVDLNQALFTPTASNSGASILARRPYTTFINSTNPLIPSFGQILLMESNQTAQYHGFQVSATKRMGHHFSLNGFYTYSKTLESVQLQNNTSQAGAEDFRNLRLERGRADDDLRHQIVMSGLWDLSYYSGDSGIAKWVLNGWSVDPILKFHSGYPFTITNSVDANLTGNTGNERASFATTAPLYPNNCANADGSMGARVGTAACWFNTSLYVRNPVTTGVFVDGNTPRNLVTGPGFVDVDLAIARHFKFGERFDLEFRAEGTNVLNRANLNPPGANAGAPPSGGFTNPVGTSNYGRIISADLPRQLQFGLRLTF